jgi:hypothetical protein
MPIFSLMLLMLANEQRKFPDQLGYVSSIPNRFRNSFQFSGFLAQRIVSSDLNIDLCLMKKIAQNVFIFFYFRETYYALGE